MGALRALKIFLSSFFGRVPSFHYDRDFISSPRCIKSLKSLQMEVVVLKAVGEGDKWKEGVSRESLWGLQGHTPGAGVIRGSREDL